MIPLDSTSITIYSLALIIVILLAWVVRLEFKMKRLFGGTGAHDLEKAIKVIHQEIANTNAFKKETISIIDDMEKRLKHSVCAVKTVRFNPFKGNGSGGNQSFATAFINEKGDGVVISSIYARDRMSVFSKSLTSFKSEFELSEEEKDVLKQAQTDLHK